MTVPPPSLHPLPPTASGDSLTETANFLLDNLVATFVRLLELPLFAVLGFVAALALSLLWAIARLAKNPRRARLAAGLRIVLAVLVVLAVLFAVDHRVAGLQERLDRQREQTSQANTALLAALTRATVTRAPLVDVAAAHAALAADFPGLQLQRLAVDDATDLLRVHIDRPLVEAWLAVVDLRHPQLEIAIDGRFDAKTLTSDFARAHGCALAINGEAGESPRPRCSLGPWRGNLLVQGEELLRELPDKPLPFLCFDRHNRARFVASTVADRALPADAWNVIWGRVDCVVDGAPSPREFRFNQPRTVMGVDQGGARLFLLVVDGRQLQRSWGFTLAEAAAFLRAFDVHGAMLCDEGGSSCMFAAVLGGIVNVPSDDDGVERPTYTHFGVRLRDGAAAK
jgi:hypothetical protein